ncbi:MAG: heme NO-binding domain-containing protein [archaeon]|nr:heme NO-binding domain-containing protein [archaeon]
MKGIVFKEFTDMVEASFGDQMIDTIISKCDLPSGAAYTAVGTYDHAELVQLVVALSEETEIEVSVLVQAFGTYLFGRFLELFPIFFTHKTSFEFLNSIHDVVHVEVLKLYPDATLPTFVSEMSDDKRTLWFEYHSPRHLADLAIGLMEGAFKHWGETVKIDVEDRTKGENQVVMFTCTLLDE